MVITTNAMALTNAANVVSLSQPKVWRIVGGRRAKLDGQQREKERCGIREHMPGVGQQG
jgi:hypothetical protein